MRGAEGCLLAALAVFAVACLPPDAPARGADPAQCRTMKLEVLQLRDALVGDRDARRVLRQLQKDDPAMGDCMFDSMWDPYGLGPLTSSSPPSRTVAP